MYWYDSPDKQIFVTEGWFVAGDFLQRERERETIQKLLKPGVLMYNKWLYYFFHSVICFEKQSMFQHKHKTDLQLLLTGLMELQQLP